MDGVQLRTILVLIIPLDSVVESSELHLKHFQQEILSYPLEYACRLFSEIFYKKMYNNITS